MPSFFRYVEPVAPRAATGVVAAVYGQLSRDFGRIAEPVSVHAPAPELLAGAWAIVRETLLVGRLPRGHKELVATAVSQSNRCPWCVDIHALAAHAGGEPQATAALIAGGPATIADPTRRALGVWAAATRTRGAPALAAPPCDPADRPELIGTALGFHYINRVVSALLVETFMPRASWARAAVQAIVPGAIAGIVRRRPTPGASLALLPAAPLPADLAWAAPNPLIAGAYAGFAAALDRHIVQLPAAAREVVQSHLAGWGGADPGMSRQWVEQAVAGVPAGAQPAARLGLLTAIAAYQIDAETIAAFRARHPAPEALITMVAWSSLSAARTIGTWL